MGKQLFLSLIDFEPAFSIWCVDHRELLKIPGWSGNNRLDCPDASTHHRNQRAYQTNIIMTPISLVSAQKSKSFLCLPSTGTTEDEPIEEDDGVQVKYEVYIGNLNYQVTLWQLSGLHPA